MSIAERIRADAAAYTGLHHRASRTSTRARVLHLLDEVGLTPTDELCVRSVTATDLAADAALLGAVVIHLDLVFRSSVTAAEVRVTAEHGLVLVAEHPDLAGFPVSVLLATPARALCERREQLFVVPARDANVLMPYALAASPRGLGAGRALLRAMLEQCARRVEPPRVTTFSPLTGLRAHVIRCVDEPAAWSAVLARANPGVDGKVLQRQLLDLLSLESAPDSMAEPARAWLRREASEFAASEAYAVGNFHRSMGASLTGVLEAADPGDSDALWWRAWFDYGRPTAP